MPESYRNDFDEAVAVLPASPKASAALSRRCLQNLLVNAAGATKRDLFDQIGEVMPNLPGHLAEAIDSVRVIGNFAAHPMKSESSGAVSDVEPNEAEWLLDTLEALFDFYFIQPTILAERRAALDAKNAEFGKPPVR